MVCGQRPKVVLRLLVCFLLAISASDSLAEDKQVFSTWEGLEADKCASIWLIKRFISPSAEVRFYPRGEAVTDGIPFDTPDAQFRRYHNKATIETLIEHYRVDDEKIKYIARVIHDIEVNVWERKVMPETEQVSAEIQAILSLEDDQRALVQCVAYFDKLYDERL
jgi:hypothetical protein